MTQPPFWQPAMARAQLWRTALGFALVMAIWMVVSFVVVVGGARLLQVPTAVLAAGNDWASAAVFFTSFIGFHIALALVLPLLHRRGYASLLGPTLRLKLRHFAIGTAVTLAIALGLTVLMALEHLVLADELVPPTAQARPLAPWLLGLLPALALILMQTFAEEAVFRGYLLQQLRARYRSAVIWGIGPALLFGLLHFQPGLYGTTNAAAYVLNATVMGTIAAFVTLRTGNLGAAAGLHFGNNASMTLMGIGGSLDGFSLFTAEIALRSGYMTYSILTQTVFTALVFLLWWRWMARHRPIANDAPAA